MHVERLEPYMLMYNTNQVRFKAAKLLATICMIDEFSDISDMGLKLTPRAPQSA